MPTDNEAILSRLDAIERKIDYVVERQRWSQELVQEMTPIAGLMMTSATQRLADWDERGAFAMLAELGTALDRVVTNYTAEDARQLADALVAILDTVRNVTRPSVLSVANEATDLLDHPESVEPVGVFGAMRQSSGDENVRRGLGMAVEALRRLGRAHAATFDAISPAPDRTPKAADHAPPEGVASRPAAPEARAPEPPTPKATAPAKRAAEEVVRWEGHDFDPSGFLIDPATWNPELAEKIAAGLGIALSDEHWLVIEWVRADYASRGASPNVRRVAKGSGIGTEAMYRLFPPTPGKRCAMIAGVPKPIGCV